MNGAEVLDVGRDAIWLTIQLCAPVLIVGLVVGVGVGLLQALTQIQEATLVYAPKIVAIFISLLEAYASLWVSPAQAVIVSFVVLILTLLFRPTGLFVPTPK